MIAATLIGLEGEVVIERLALPSRMPCIDMPCRRPLRLIAGLADAAVPPLCRIRRFYLKEIIPGAELHVYVERRREDLDDV